MTGSGPPSAPDELRDWLRALKKESGLSYNEIAGAIDEDPRNVKRWMPETGEPVIPRGDVMLRLLATLGVQITPLPPESVRVRSVIESLRELLDEVERLLQVARELAGAEEPARIGRVGRRLEEVADLTARGFEALGVAPTRLQPGEDVPGHNTATK